MTKHIGSMCVVGAVLIVSVLAASTALALPDISVTLTGGAYPVHAQATLANAAVSFGTASGVSISGSGITLLLSVTELSALGTFSIAITNYENNEKVKCNTAGDAGGVLLLPGEFHLVPISLAPLTLGILFLLSEFEIICPKGVVPIGRGNVIASVNDIGSEGTELAGFSSGLSGELGKQNISEYYNDGGTKIKAKLELEAGAGFVAASLNVAGELGLSALGSKMILIKGR
jgi:hypothetical protein